MGRRGFSDPAEQDWIGFQASAQLIQEQRMAWLPRGKYAHVQEIFLCNVYVGLKVIPVQSSPVYTDSQVNYS